MTILIPLPDVDFDVTEVAVPWSLLTEAGFEVVFATERGDRAPRADPRLLTGVIFGQLGAAPDAKRLYALMERSAAFQRPMSWDALDPGEFAGVLLPGGHAPGMRQYLGSERLQAKIAEFWTLDRPVGAICHGVLLLARARDPRDGRPLIHARRTTCLPKYMERNAFLVTGWKLGRYYRTYPAYVEDEVRASLDDPATQFVRGPITLNRRGTGDDDRAAFVVEDGNYVSGRWTGDAYLFATRFLRLLREASEPTQATSIAPSSPARSEGIAPRAAAE